MNLIQLRYLREIVGQGLNISLAADVLHTSQSGISRQIQLLEEELKLQIFQRNGKRLVGVTEPGKIIVGLANRVLSELDNIKRVGEEFTQKDKGSITIATTHTQARYFLPPAVKQFMQRYPNVTLAIHQGNPTQVAEQVLNGEADLAIASEAINTYDKLLCLPCYQWNRCILAPQGHPLLATASLSLQDIAHFPLITYDFTFTGGSLVKRVFNQAGLEPNVVLTAIDADVIKTYVTLGLGVGLLASMAYNPERDAELGMRDVSHLFPNSTTYLALRKDLFLRDFVVDFIALLVPKLNRAAISKALSTVGMGGFANS